MDGDTLRVRGAASNSRANSIDREFVVRLAEIDAPESDQPFGPDAKAYLQSWPKTNLLLVPQSKDRYGRVIGHVFAAERAAHIELLRTGLAWHYKQFSKDEKLAAIEAEARAAKRGLWSDPNPVAPWDWRKRKPETAAQ